MARVKLDPVKFRTEYAKDKINGDMKRNNITRQDLGRLWGKTPQAAGANISKMNMTFIEFIQLVKVLNWDDEQIAKVVKL